MYLLFEMCNDSGILTVFLILKYLFNIICTIIPLILIYRGFVPLFKAVTSGKEFSGELGPIVKSIIAGLIIFLLPGLFNFIFTDIVGYSNSFSQCVTNAELDFIKELKKAESEGRAAEVLKQREELMKASEERDKLEKEKNDKIKEEIKKKEEQERLEQEQANQNASGGNGSNNGSNSSGGSPGSSNVNLSGGEKNIIIGDSRTVGMCASITGDWTHRQFSNGGAFVSGNDIYIAQGSKGYSWFNSTAVSAVNSIISSNPNVKFNVYSLMGVNFLLSDIDKYIPTYNSLANGAWNNHNLILVSVNPVDEAKESQNGYSTKNANIVTFNNKLKNGTAGVSNIKYCDTYNSIINNLGTSDGLHYTSTTYKAIYNSMMSCGS